MTGQYRVSTAAQQALDAIYLYSLAHFGEAKAAEYLTDLFERFEAIAAGNVTGREIPPVFGVKGRFTRCGKHYVYWKTLHNGDIGIAEILHERMNIGDWLAESDAFQD